MNPKNSKKSPIHENADANITCDFGDGDISRSRSFLSNTCDTYIASSIIVRLDKSHGPTCNNTEKNEITAFLNL